jgi:hypothetical protein
VGMQAQFVQRVQRARIVLWQAGALCSSFGQYSSRARRGDAALFDLKARQCPRATEDHLARLCHRTISSIVLQFSRLILDFVRLAITGGLRLSTT